MDWAVSFKSQINWRAFLSINNDLENSTELEEKNKTNGLLLSLGPQQAPGRGRSRRSGAFLKTDSQRVRHSAPSLPPAATPGSWELSVCLSRTFLLNNWLRKSWRASIGPEPQGNPNGQWITRSALSPEVVLCLCTDAGGKGSVSWRVKIQHIGRYFWEALLPDCCCLLIFPLLSGFYFIISGA